MPAKSSAKSKTASPSKIAVLDGKLHIYIRANSRYWQCGFHHNSVYIRESTKLTELDAATEFAKLWYYGKQAELKLGAPIALRKTTFNHFADLAIADYGQLAEQGRASASYVRGLILMLESNLKPFFGRYPLKSINQQLWHKYQGECLSKKKISPATIKQHLNGLRVVFRRAKLRGEIVDAPKLVTERRVASDATPRTWFQPKEYETLFKALRKNIRAHEHTRWREDAEELHDYVLFMASSGLRVGEAKNLRFCDVEIVQDPVAKNALGEPRSYLILRNLIGKRGRGGCKTHFGAHWPFERIIERRGLSVTWKNSQEPVFLRHHRDMFNKVLTDCGLKFTTDVPPRRRDLMSLRHTYICFRLMDGAGVYDIAANCRTSVTMIEDHYARWLSPVMANINVHSLKIFGREEGLSLEEDTALTE